jgi:cation transport protein ChaC
VTHAPAGGAKINEPDVYGGEDAVPDIAPALAYCLGRAADLWIFAYGSLMWHPGFPHDATAPALLRGWHRSFCVYSRNYRGTPERPGLVLGLDRGGSCRGMAFRVPQAEIEPALTYLWMREMAGGVYRMRSLAVETASGRVEAQAFTVRRDHPGYAGKMTLEETARLIVQGNGCRGPCRDYLANTVRHIETLGLDDGPLHRLEERVQFLAASLPAEASRPEPLPEALAFRGDGI